jgi:hypothetical protein
MAENVQKILSIELKANDAIQGLQKLNSQIEENRARMRELADANQKGSLEYAKLEQQTKALSKAKQSLSRETQNEIKLEYEQKGSINALQAELSRLTQKYNALSEAERKNGAEGKRLNKQINEITNELNAAEQGIQKYYRNVGNYQNAIIGAMGANNKYIQSMMLIASSSQGATGAFGAITTSIKAFGNALWGLMSNPVFLAIAGIAGTGMAFKWFYDYNVEVEHATRLTREFTGVTGSELTHLRAEIQATASTFGKDYKEVLEGVDLLMSHFGLTSSEAIKTLNDGFVIGADINGNYLQLLKQYAPVFKDAGVSAQQLVALIQQTRSGIFSQQGLEAIKQASARIREMSSSTRSSLEGIGIDVTDLQRKLATHEIEMIDAVQMVSDKLKETSNNTQEYGNVMADVFGRQGKFSSQEMIESLGDIDTNLQNLKVDAGEYGKALEDNQKATADLEEETAKMFGAGEHGWETLKVRADTLWKTSLTNVIKRIRDLIGRFAEMGKRSQVFRTVAQVIAGVIWQLTGGIIDAFRAVGAGFKAIGSWIDAFINTFKSAFGIIRDLGRGVGDILSGNVSKGIDEISNGLSKGITNALKGLNTALKDTVNIGRAATTGFRNAYNAMGNFFDNYQPYDDDFTPSSGGGGSEYAPSEYSPSATSSSGGGKKGGGSKSTPKKLTTTKPATPKRDTEAERLERERQNRMAALIKKGAELETKAREEVLKTTAEGIVQMYKERADAIFAQFEGIETKTEEEAEALAKARNAMLKANLDEQAKELQKFKDAQAKKNADAEAKAAEDAKRLVQTQLAGTTEGTAEWLNYQLELLRMEKEAELALYGNTEEEKAAILAKYRKQEEDARMQNSQAIQQIEQTKYDAIGTMVGGLGEVVGAFGEQSKEAAVLQKTLALGEIMIAQAVAIANAVKAGSNAVTPWQLIAQIATSIVAVTSAMAQAFAALDSAKFATGGYIQGAGTSTSDSIPVRVSNGESIMNANTTAMFSGLLSSLNQLGGGVPIQAQQTASSVRGEDMLARAVARGVAMLPAPVVSVEDINRGQRQVEVMNERATL